MDKHTEVPFLTPATCSCPMTSAYLPQRRQRFSKSHWPLWPCGLVEKCYMAILQQNICLTESFWATPGIFVGRRKARYSKLPSARMRSEGYGVCGCVCPQAILAITSKTQDIILCVKMIWEKRAFFLKKKIVVTKIFLQVEPVDQPK